jgi:hypothetical protein
MVLKIIIGLTSFVVLLQRSKSLTDLFLARRENKRRRPASGATVDAGLYTTNKKCGGPNAEVKRL